jgi:hypothetical protein
MLAVFISILVVLPDQVNAAYLWEGDDDWDETLEIVVIEATYMDYDNDKQEDDILTIFQIIVPDEWEKGEIDVSCAVEKPSGMILATSFTVKTKGSVEITIVWINYADEAGWYTLYVKADVKKANIDDVGPAYIEHEFDPPGWDKGPPEIELVSIIEL